MLMKQWVQLRNQMQTKEDITRLSQQHPQHSYDVLRAMYDQLFQRHVSHNFYLLRQHGHDFVRLFDSGQKSLIEIANDFNLTPVMVARRVLQLKYTTGNDNPNATSKRRNNPDKRKITRILRDPSLIENESLRNQIDLCIQQDDAFGPNVDRTRAVLGLEYEALLIQYVRNIRLEFETENDLRKRSSFKTPDILLRVPIAFHGKIICWIDSKAKFADEYTLKKDYTDSVSSYIGRFGPGMVIYWFGYISDCICPMLQDDGVLVADQFPDEQSMQALPGTQLPQSVVEVNPWVTKPS